MKPTSWIGVSAAPRRASDASSAQPAYGPRGTRRVASHSAPGQKPDVQPPLNRSRPSAPSPSGKRPGGVRACRSATRWSSSASRRAAGVTVRASIRIARRARADEPHRPRHRGPDAHAVHGQAPAGQLDPMGPAPSAERSPDGARRGRAHRQPAVAAREQVGHRRAAGVGDAQPGARRRAQRERQRRAPAGRLRHADRAGRAARRRAARARPRRPPSRSRWSPRARSRVPRGRRPAARSPRVRRRSAMAGRAPRQGGRRAALRAPVALPPRSSTDGRPCGSLRRSTEPPTRPGGPMSTHSISGAPPDHRPA